MPLLDIVVPEDIGDVDECVIVTWFKRVGDSVERDSVLLILQAEKISFEVPAPATGQVTAILAQQGEIVQKGQLLAQMEAESLPAAAPPPPPESRAEPIASTREVRASPIAKRLAREHNLDLSGVSGTGEEGRITEKDVLDFLEARQARPGSVAAPPAREVRASPVAKRMAREHNIDLAQIVVSDGEGRITEKDVLDFIAAQEVDVTGEPDSTSSPTPPQGETIPLTGMRAAIARRMVDSLHTMAQLTLHTEADVTELVSLRDKLKQQIPVTYTDLVVRACALALRQHPRLNATLDGETIRLLPHINIGLAVALDDGLIVPVIPGTDQHNLASLVQTRSRLVDRARAGQLTPAEVSGGTFTVTNLGNYDIDTFTPIINPPEAAILGVGRIVEKVVIHQGKIAQRMRLNLSLTFDHRLVDGAPAAAFLQAVKQLLEAPEPLKN